MTSWSTLFRKLVEAKKVGAYYDPKGVGIRTTHWFWASADRIKSAQTPAPPADDQAQVPTEGESADQEVDNIILENPMVSGAALVNAMKAKGLKVVKVTEKNNFFKQCALKIKGLAKAKKEADSASANAASLVAKESNFNFTSVTLKESASDDGVGPTRFKVILLQEGLGNMRDAYYYSKEALSSAIPVFTGSKIYADHPSAMEEEIRPERSVRDVLGHFENLNVEEADGGVSVLAGELCILPDKPFEWARGLVRHAIEHSNKFPGKEFIGLSINASGDADEIPMEEMLKRAPDGAKPKLIEAKNSGIDTVRIVTRINSAVSCDLVTEAGAGGKIISTIG